MTDNKNKNQEAFELLTYEIQQLMLRSNYNLAGYKEVKELINKNIPKMNWINKAHPECVCGQFMNDRRYKFCPICGQALDWEEK